MLAQKRLLTKQGELKLSIAMHLCKLTNYHLDESLRLAEKVVADLSAQFANKEKNKVSFEHIARAIEDEIDLITAPGNANFEDVLTAIKEECVNFSARTEYLFTSLYHSKKREYGNQLSSAATDELIDQDDARRLLQERALNYMLKHVDPAHFHSTFINLGMEGVLACNEQNSLNNFHTHHEQVLRNLQNSLNETYDNFFIENAISPQVKEKLNYTEIKHMFFQMLTKGYMNHKQEMHYTLQNNLTSADVLLELDADIERQKSLLPTQGVSASQAETPENVFTYKDKTKEETEFFVNLFQKEKLHQFQYFMRIKKPTQDVMRNIIGQLNGKKGSEDYLKIIDSASIKSGFSGGHLNLFKKPMENAELSSVARNQTLSVKAST